MTAQPSLTEGLAERFTDEFSQGIDVGADVVSTITLFERDTFSVDEVLNMAVDEIVTQKILEEGVDDVRASVMLFSADLCVREFFEKQRSMS